MLFLCGAVVPIDPRTGVAIGLPWLADGNTPSGQRDYTAAEFPIQGGYGIVTDAILRSPPVLPVVFLLSDSRSQLNPLPSFRGRKDKLLRDFEAIEARLGPCRVWVRGYPPLKNYGITNVSASEIEGKRAISLAVTFRKLAYTSLFAVPPGVDPELLALGVLPV